MSCGWFIYLNVRIVVQCRNLKTFTGIFYQGRDLSQPKVVDRASAHLAPHHYYSPLHLTYLSTRLGF